MTPRQEFSAAETARRRDEVVRRMANTPPQPKVIRQKKKIVAGPDRVPPKGRANS